MDSLIASDFKIKGRVGVGKKRSGNLIGFGEHVRRVKGGELHWAKWWCVCMRVDKAVYHIECSVRVAE